MRSITVSLDVYARIWALRMPKENSEDDVLRRVLFENLKSTPTPKGITDDRFGVQFDEGFEVFRNYRGQKFVAKVSNGQWRMAGHDDAFGSLSDLSRAVGAKTENAWESWFYRTTEGKKPVSTLRDPSRITRRRNLMNIAYAAEQKDGGRWIDDVVEALNELGGTADLNRIYEAVTQTRKRKGRSLPPSIDAVIRRTLENYSSDSDAFLEKEDFFCMPHGKGAGVWALRK